MGPVIILLAFSSKDGITAATAETFQMRLKIRAGALSPSGPSFRDSVHIRIKLLTISPISQHKFPSISESKCFPVVRHSGAIVLKLCMS